MAKLSAREYLKRWVQGTLRWSEEQQLNQAATHDPFLADAWEGLQSRPTGDHAQQLAMLRARLQQRRSQRMVWLVRATAAIAVLALAGWAYRFFLTRPPLEPVAVTVAPSVDSLPVIAQRESAPAQPRAATTPLPTIAPERPVATPTKPTASAAAKPEETVNLESLAADPSAVTEEATPQARADRALPSPSTAPWGVGKVLDAAGQPLVGAQILANDASWASATTADGEFIYPLGDATLEVGVGFPRSNTLRQANLAQNPTIVLSEPLPEAKASGLPVPQQARKTAESIRPVPGPVPNGGWTALYNYLQRNIAPGSRPTPVVVRFRLDPAGRPSEIELLSPLPPTKAEQVRQLLWAGPIWQPINFTGFVYLSWEF